MGNVYKNIANNIHLLPFIGYQIYQKTDEGHSANRSDVFYQVESESSYRFTPVTRQRPNGSLATLGHKLELSVYISFNTYAAFYFFVNKLYDYEDELPHHSIILGNGKARPIGLTEESIIPPKVINATNNMRIDIQRGLDFTFEIESVALRPRTIIRTQGFVKKEELLFNTFEA